MKAVRGILRPSALLQYRNQPIVCLIFMGLVSNSCISQFEQAKFPRDIILISATVETPKLEIPFAPLLLPSPTTNPSAPFCDYEGTFWRCTDELLGVEFDLPVLWGPIIQTSASPGRCGGYGYGYAFENQNEIWAGGASFDYCEPTEGIPFIGFRKRWHRPQNQYVVQDIDGCNLFSKSIYCEYIDSNIVIAMYFPESKSLCEPHFGMVWEPYIQVAVSLPMNRHVQGISFGTHILSAQLEEQLFEPLGGLTWIQTEWIQFRGTVCEDTNAMEKFDDWFEAIAQSVIDSRVDDETNYQLQLVREFARSIKISSD